MDAGRLDRVITIEELTFSRDSFGQEVGRWNPRWSGVRAQFLPSGGVEVPVGRIAEQSTTTAVFRIRYRRGLNPKVHRIRFDGEIWEIKAASEVPGRRAWLDVQCTADEVTSGS